MTDPNVVFSGDDENRQPLRNDVVEDADRREFEAWKAQRGNDKPAESSVYSPTAPSGRKVAPTEPSKSEARTPEAEEEEKPQSYVWLVNGEVLLVNDEDLPGHAGHGAENGYWEKDGKVFQIVNVYPRETVIKEK